MLFNFHAVLFPRKMTTMAVSWIKNEQQKHTKNKTIKNLIKRSCSPDGHVNNTRIYTQINNTKIYRGSAASNNLLASVLHLCCSFSLYCLYFSWTMPLLIYFFLKNYMVPIFCDLTNNVFLALRERALVVLFLSNINTVLSNFFGKIFDFLFYRKF